MDNGNVSAVHKLNQWKESLHEESMKLLSESFPEHMRRIEMALQHPKFSMEQYEKFTRNTALYYFNCSEMGTGTSEERHLAFVELLNSNRYIAELHSVVKPIFIDSIFLLEQLSRWITLLIPKMETGDNLGVATQEAAISLTNQVSVSANALLKWIFEFRKQRSKLLVTFMSSPFIEEKKDGILSFDKAEVESLALSLKGLIYNFAYVHDFVKKNMDQITLPRSSDTYDILTFLEHHECGRDK
uniref:Proteasome activator PA28 C-terminal domain-containing protein n=1 Tax=Trichuris muris TaxID=70415 RepID=A0A5S6QEP8_TRIMR